MGTRKPKCRKSNRYRKYNGEKKDTRTMIYITPCRKLEIEEQNTYSKPGVNSGAPEGLVVPTPPVSSVVFNDTNII